MKKISSRHKHYMALFSFALEKNNVGKVSEWKSYQRNVSCIGCPNGIKEMGNSLMLMPLNLHNREIGPELLEPPEICIIPIDCGGYMPLMKVTASTHPGFLLTPKEECTQEQGVSRKDISVPDHIITLDRLR